MTKRLFCCYTLILSALAPVAGQQSQPSSPTRQQNISAPQDEVVRVTTNLVQVDVVVTDKEGRHVADLLPEDFEITEEKRKRQITDFSYITNEPESSSPAPVTRTAPPDSKSNTVTSPAVLRPGQVRRTIALVVDDLGLSFESLVSVREALRNFVNQQMRANDLVAVIRTSRGTGASQQFTSDKRQLLAAVENIRWFPAGRGGVSPFAPVNTQREETTTNAAQLINEMEEAREANYAVGSLGALGFVIRGLGELPGRKSVLLVSESFRLFTSQGRNVRLLEGLRRLTDQANLASTVIYTLDASGLNPLNLTAEDKVAGIGYMFDPNTLQPQVVPTRNREAPRRSDVPAASIAAQAEADSAAAFRKLDALMKQRDSQDVQTQSVLSYLAQRTGGLFINNTNDLSLGTRRMMEDQRGYYLIGYRPDEPVVDPATGRRRHRDLTVKVKRPGLRVRTREGFYGIATENTPPVRRTRDEQLAAALTSPFTAGDVKVRVTPLFGNDQSAGSYVSAMLHVDVRDLTFTEQPNGSRKAVMDVVAVNFGDGGRVVEQFADTQTIEVTPDSYQGLMDNGLSFVLNVPVKQPGAYQLRVAVRDTSSERVGAAGQFIDVPDLKGGRLALSGILLRGTDPAPAGGAPAEKKSDGGDSQAGPAVRRLRQGMILNYGYTIFNAQGDGAGRPQLQTQMRLFREGKEVFTGKVLVYDPAQQADLKQLNAGGRIRIGPDLIPGEYVLQVDATDNLVKDKSRGATATQSIDFEIVK